MYVYDYDQFGHTDRSDCFQPELKATQIVAFDANICIAANQKNRYDYDQFGHTD